MRTLAVLLFAAVAALGGRWSAPLEAQQAAETWTSFSQANSAPEVGTAALLQAQLPCPDCDPPTRFWPAFGELMIVQLIPWSINRFVRDLEFAKVSLDSWWTNVSNPWVWDNNEFLNNQFSHPYHGNLYFNAGRTNGYNFWKSMLWAGGGSLMWEWFGEAWAPAPNDWLNTTLGGISLGEMLYRSSSLTLDNTATGSERVFREIGATLMNPVRGFNRLIRGEMGSVTANPADWRPSRVQAAIDVGYRSTGRRGGSETLDQTFTRFVLSYGDQVQDVDGDPFSTVTVTFGLASNQAPQRALSMLTARGNLGALRLRDEPRSVTMLAAFMQYEFYSSPAFEFGGQGFSAGPVVRWGDLQGFRIQGEALATFMPASALRSDHFQTLEGRDYDYGVGIGGSAKVQAIWEGIAGISLRGRMLYSPTISGFPGGHFQAVATLEGRGYLKGRIGAGFSASAYRRNSWYRDFDNVRLDGWELNVYGSYAIPRWLP